MSKMLLLRNELEVVFGPDTCELCLRIGIHSGPVTGGFLKGKGARFQLFGDTVTMAVQVARSGESGRIHISSTTAEHITRCGKKRWLEPRSDEVTGGGSTRTYWLVRNQPDTDSNAIPGEDRSSFDGSDLGVLPPQHEGADDDVQARHRRLIDWNVEVLHQLLKQIVARRLVTFKRSDESSNSDEVRESSRNRGSLRLSTSQSSEGSNAVPPSMPLDEVKEIIALPAFDRKASVRQKDPSKIVIPEVVLDQLKDLVTTIAMMYNDNPFHNFSHASHVVMAVTKFMTRINEAKELEVHNQLIDDRKLASALHDHTYGITSDPLTQFAYVFSALIHDVDHPGVPNPQLVKENEILASIYRCRSVAEQNSFDLSWKLLMDTRYKDLRCHICATSGELLRFRQIVINSVMATDLGDKELKELRNNRWDKAFAKVAEVQEEAKQQSSSDVVNRKATIVVEHLIQAADISHTTQHWEVYRIWNENLFRELYKAYVQGRSERNPADFWYEGEIGFFDYYIIPLSKKLRDCGVFGLTSDENLNYAMQNREMWIERGQEIVMEMLDRARAEFQ